MTVIAMSMETGTFSHDFAIATARALNLQLADHRRLELDLAERCDSNGDLPLMLPHASASTRDWTVRRRDLANRVREEMLETAARGGVLIVGWSAPAILRSLAHVCCVAIRASLTHRVATVQQHLHYPSRASAALEIEFNDGLMTQFVQRLFGTDYRDLDNQDLVLDAARLTAAQCQRQLGLLAESVRYRETTAARTAVAAAIEVLSTPAPTNGSAEISQCSPN